MTLHSAKGLEFDTVFLVGLEDGIFPSNRILAESPDIQEERRLLYVGITRACKRLFISFAQTRHMFGTIQAQNPSRFLSELPENIAYFDFSSHPSYIQEINIENVIKDMIKDVPLAGASTWISNKQITTHKQIFNQKSTYEKQNYPEKKYTVAKNAISMGSLVWHVVYGDGIIKKQEVRESGTYFHVEFKKGLYIVHEKFLALKP